ncbi:MAG: peptidase T [Clostridia bacterium]
MKKVLDRFLKYVAIDTESDPKSESYPSSQKQKNLLKELVLELLELGIENARMDENGYVYASIPATIKDGVKLGFLAHVDTSSAVSGKNIQTKIVYNYDGKDIVLNEKLNIVMSPNVYPVLKDCINQDLIVTDGTTLLGADDKAGIAEIMAMAEYYMSHKEIPHGEILIAFTPDEEVGSGVKYFNLNEFKADYAYTIDGGALGEIEYENFNAASMEVLAHGASIHPGTAKDRMINAIEVLYDFHNLLPCQMRPQYTEKYEGFYHLDEICGKVQEANANYIIRDHDWTKFQEKKEYAKKACNLINEKYGKCVLEVNIKDSYYNMKEKVLPHMHLIKNAEIAMTKLGVVAQVMPIRGGTDGAHLSFKGLVCPNLCTGGYNFHGIYEFIPIQSMEKIVDILIEIVKLYTNV